MGAAFYLDGMEPLIRICQPRDLRNVLDLWRRCGIHLGFSERLDQLRRAFDCYPELFLLAEFGTRIIGAVWGTFDGRRGVINHLAVDSDWRGQGLGEALLKELLTRLAQLNAVKVHLQVQRDNDERYQRLVAWYCSLGFYPRDDLVMMSVDLRENSWET